MKRNGKLDVLQDEFIMDKYDYIVYDEGYTMREKHGKVPKFLIATLIIILICVCVLITILFFSNKLEGEMHGQLENNLRDVAHQNEMALKNQIHSNELLLKGIASDLMSDSKELEEIV